MNLATESRPHQLSDVVGQDVSVLTVQHAFEMDQVASSYICIGKHGTGKTTMGRIIARLLLCSNRDGAVACDTCLNCQNSLRGACPDIHEMDASDMGINDVRALKADAAYRPLFGKNKVYLIDEVHSFSHQGFQALLKILEEPPEYVYFILATTEPSRVPKTILSRCQRLAFNDLSPTIIKSRLSHVLELKPNAVSPEMLDLIATLGEGSMRDALTILEAVITNGYSKSEQVYAHFGIPNPSQAKKLTDAVLGGDGHTFAQVLTELEIGSKLNLERCYTMLLDHLSHRLSTEGFQLGQYCARHLMYLIGAQSLFSNPHLKPRQIFDVIVMRVMNEMTPYRTDEVLQELRICA